jgi:GxxExxY protein
MDNKYKHSELTQEIIKAFYTVYNKLGFGFAEKVYEKALLIELSKKGLSAEKQKLITVYYDGQIVGEFFADIMVEDKIIIELKAAEFLCPEHEFQLLNYLKASEIEVGLLINFGKKPEVKRRIYTNQ